MGDLVEQRSVSSSFVIRSALVLVVAAIAAIALPAAAGAHKERETTYPDINQGDFPEYRTDGPSFVVCKRDTRRRIGEIQDPSIRRTNLRLLPRCRFRDIQTAVNKAENNHRILVLPGVYREKPSLKPAPPGCEQIYTNLLDDNDHNDILEYEQQRQCPNAQNLIAVFGDTNGNGICDSKCNVQIEGTGEEPGDVAISGDRFSQPGKRKLNGIRGDRADGLYVKNLLVEFFDFNGVYFIETNGFRFDQVISRWSREYGILSFSADHGIYENCETYGNGDSGLYPGSGPNGRHGQPDVHGHVYGIIIRYCDSHDNLMGTSATSGNGTWYHHNRLHHNASGTVTDAIVGDHPGMPPDHSKWSENLYYSNNKALFSNGPIPPGEYTDDKTTGRDEYCKQPIDDRDLKVVCPSFFMPIGTGLLLAGTNNDIVENNYFFDNWRLGAALLYVPEALRNMENPDPSRQADTSNNNRIEGNCMETRPAVLDPAQIDFSQCQGVEDRNGVDLWWDKQEGTDCLEVDQDPSECVDAVDNLGNCWSGNEAFGGATPSGDPDAALLPGCPGIDLPRGPDPAKSGLLVPCVTWDPHTNTDPAGCEMAGSSWFDVPADPGP